MTNTQADIAPPDQQLSKQKKPPLSKGKLLTALMRLYGILVFALGLILLLLAHAHQPFAIWYAAYIYPAFPHTVGRLFGLVPFSVFEILLLLICLCLVTGLIYTIVRLSSATGRKKLKSQTSKALRHLINILAIVFLIFVLVAGINYNRESYADHLGISVQDSALEDLLQLYHLLLARSEYLAGQINTDANGHFLLTHKNLYPRAQQAMQDLHQLHGGLVSYFPRPKAPLLSRQLSYLRTAGFFAPWTLEAHYNSDIPGQSIPFTINHELAHLAGHMREDEANFIAYLASRNTADIDFQYSATYIALSYTLNALHRVIEPEQYRQLFALLPSQLQQDFAAASAYWQSFQGPAAEVATRSNDLYLRFNRQHDGVQSYGRMVDLLLAYYRSTDLWADFAINSYPQGRP